jgi:hypothetical protein
VSLRRSAALLGWSLLAVVVAAWLSIVEVLWLPLRIGGVLVPLSIAAAVLGNLLLVPGAYRLSRSRAVGVLPAAVWLVVALGASQPRPEGDLLLIGGGSTGAVNLAFLLVGMVAAAFAVARILGGPRRGTRRPRPGEDGPQRGASR